MGNADSVPVVSQTKSLVQAISGDTEGARRTQENFSRQCPVVSQARSLVEVSMGDPDAAAETQKQFVKGASDFADKVPVVGHIKGGIHYACGDREGGDKAMMHATRGIVFNAPLMAVYGMFSSDNNDEDDDVSTVFNTRIAKEFDGVKLSDWTRSLDNEMAVACYETVKALKQRKNTYGVNLTWDDVLEVFCNCLYIKKDENNSKHFNDKCTLDEVNYFKFDGSPEEVRKIKIINWLKKLFNDHEEQSIYDNCAIFKKSSLNELASIASQSGATVRDPVTLLGASEKKRKKVKEISAIRFPKKMDKITNEGCKIKIYRIVIFSWFKCTRVLFGQHDETGFEIEYDSFEFRPNAAAIDERCAAEARNELSKQDIFDF